MVSKPDTSWWKTAVYGAALVLITLVAYFPAMHAGLIWDDNALIFQSAVIQSDDAPVKIWTGSGLPDYYPVTWTSLWIDRLVWGDAPAGYHIENILLHAFSAIVLWRILCLLSISGAFAAAMIFAVHPVCVSSVAWISERKNTLSLLLLALAMLAYLRSEENGLSRSRRWYGLAIISFVLAMLSKVSVAMMPVVMLILDWWRHGRIERRTLLKLIPFFTISLVLGLVAIYFMKEKALGTISVRPEGFLSKLAASGWCIWFYLYKLVLPVRLAMVYPRWDVDPAMLISWVPLLILICAFWVAWQQRKTWGRHVLTASGCYVVLLFPALGFVDIGIFQHALVADHLQYVGMIAPIALMTASVATWLRHLRISEFNAKALFTLVVLLLATLTWHKAVVFDSEKTLWTDTLSINPQAWIAHNNIGLIETEAERYESAINHYNAALAIRPQAPLALNNLGIALAKSGHTEEAIDHFRAALEVWPDYVRGHYNLGLALAILGDTDGAIEHHRRTIEISPDYVVARIDLADALVTQRRYGEAIEQYERALPAFQDQEELHFKLGMALFESDQVLRAIDQFRMAVHLESNSVRSINSLAWALATRPGASDEQCQEAVGLAKRAARLTNQRDPRVLDTLAAALAANAQIEAAITTSERAIQLAEESGNPDLAEEIRQRLVQYRHR